jgi:hypothetical protein
MEIADWSVLKNIERSSLMGREAQGDIKRYALSIEHSVFKSVRISE